MVGQALDAQRMGWVRAVDGAETRDLGRLARKLEEDMFGVPPGKMERDPFRFLSVSDAEAPPEQVRIDEVTVQKRSASTLEQQGIEMHAQRLVSEADGSGVRPLRLTLAPDERRICHAKVKELLTRPLD